MSAAPPLAPALEVRSPASGALIGHAPLLGASEVHGLVARARAAQPAWARRAIQERCALIDRLRGCLAAAAEDLADLSCAETGKLPFEALLTDVLTTCQLARWCARRAPVVLASRRVPSGWLLTKRASVGREPFGVIGVIGPWNFPILNVMRAVLPALTAGNTVVLKPSEATPLTGLRLAELAGEAGLPPDVFLVATGDGRTGAALVEAGVDKIVFTGSVETGRRVARAAAERLLPVALELGGKDPLVVLDGADLERAARAAVAGAFMNTGQICTSIERVYVEAPVYDAFVSRVLEEARAVRLGAPEDPDADVGAVTTEAQMSVLEAQLADALARGARLLAGGHRRPGPGRFFEPTVLADVDHSMAIMREETFGPVLPIMKVADAEDALRCANDSRFALGASLWAPRRRAERLAPRIRAGMACVNDALVNGMVASLPFGGTAESGYGSLYGDDGLLEMTRPRALLVDRSGWRREFAHYPLRRFGRVRVLGLVGLLEGPGFARRVRGVRRLITGRK